MEPSGFYGLATKCFPAISVTTYTATSKDVFLWFRVLSLGYF